MISLIVPCYNEEAVIAETASRLVGVMGNIGGPFEIIFINDGSSDGTLKILEDLCEKEPRIKCISFSRNFGHQPAVSAGIHFATGDAAIILDADLQDPPEMIPEMIQKWKEENCNVVFAVRQKRLKVSWLRRFSMKTYYRVINYLSEVPLPLDVGDFRLIDRKVIDAFKSFGEKQKYVRGLISWVGFKQVPIYYERPGRFAGETKYSFGKLFRLARMGLVYFSSKPLTLALSLGIFSFFVGIALTVYVLISKFYFPATTPGGWSSLLIAIIFFGGVQLISIGLLGAYLGSIFNEVKARPEYIIERKINYED